MVVVVNVGDVVVVVVVVGAGVADASGGLKLSLCRLNVVLLSVSLMCVRDPVVTPRI